MHSSIEGEIREPKETRDSQREREGEEEEGEEGETHIDRRQQAAGSWTAATTTTGAGAGTGAATGAATATACPAVIPAQLAVNASAAAALLAANFTTAPPVAQWAAAAASAVVVGHQAGSSRRCVDSGPPSGTAIDMDTAMAAAARMNIKTPPRPRHSIRSCWPSYCCRVSNWQVSEAPTDINIDG